MALPRLKLQGESIVPLLSTLSIVDSGEMSNHSWQARCTHWMVLKVLDSQAEGVSIDSATGTELTFRYRKSTSLAKVLHFKRQTLIDLRWAISLVSVNCSVGCCNARFDSSIASNKILGLGRCVVGGQHRCLLYFCSVKMIRLCVWLVTLATSLFKHQALSVTRT